MHLRMSNSGMLWRYATAIISAPAIALKNKSKFLNLTLPGIAAITLETYSFHGNRGISWEYDRARRDFSIWLGPHYLIIAPPGHAPYDDTESNSWFRAWAKTLATVTVRCFFAFGASYVAMRYLGWVA